MTKIKYRPDYWNDVPDEWKETIDRMYLEEYNSDRSETRRHQSLDKSMESGFDVPDLRVNIVETVIRREEKIMMHNALKLLTDKQYTVLIFYAVYEYSFRKIGELLRISKDTAKEHYHSAMKKMKKLFGNTPSKLLSRGF